MVNWDDGVKCVYVDDDESDKWIDNGIESAKSND